MSADELTSLRTRVLVLEGALEKVKKLTLQKHANRACDLIYAVAEDALQGLSQDQGREGCGVSGAESGGTASPKSDGLNSAGSGANPSDGSAF
jgi:hypothetical protein